MGEKAGIVCSTAAMASGLLSSTASTASLAPRASCSSCRPPSTSCARRLSSVSSAVRYGSHSQALAMRVSALPTAPRSFVSVGKAAPPIPIMPAHRMISSSCCGERAEGSAAPCRASQGVSRRSFPMTMEGMSLPLGWRRSSMASTVPDTEAWTGAPSAVLSAMGCPTVTVSPTETQGVQGWPICCTSGSITWAGAGRVVSGRLRERILPS